MRQKYIDEKYPPLMVLGNHPDGRVSVCDSSGRVDVLMSPEDAENIVASYNRVQSKLVACAMAFYAANPQAFNEFWYGDENDGAH